MKKLVRTATPARPICGEQGCNAKATCNLLYETRRGVTEKPLCDVHARRV